MKFGTQGMMAVDYEERINFDRLRRERVAKIKEEMEKTELGCLLLFDSGNKRYATSTAVASPEVDNMGRYAIVPRGGEPYIFGFGSEVAAEKINCPWIRDRTFPAHTTMFGALPFEWGAWKNFLKDLRMVLEANGISEKDPIGVDYLDSQLILALQQEGFKIGDGQDVMLRARMIKTDDEIQIMRNAAATVDAAFDSVARMLRPGVRENDIQATAAHTMHTLGGQWVINVQVTSGSRTHPHPHLSSDRLLQPGDLVFMDIVTLLNGYHTCYYRTLCCGRATERQKDIYKRTYELLQAGIERCRAGATTADIVKAWPAADYWGFKSESEAFGLAFGHGLGVGLWERPMITRLYSLDHPVELKEGMVIALETYYGEGRDGARIEEEVVVTADGPEVITRFPAEELIECNKSYAG
ncbi:MAG: aminopeptidase P family protein [Armatimonadetes bacterium]|nr:aminopeptidase P family protein [Armatimonadota bacterium]